MHKFKMSNCIVQKQVQTKLKIQITTCCHNPKSAIYCQNAKKSTQSCQEEDLAKISKKIKVQKLSKKR